MIKHKNSSKFTTVLILWHISQNKREMPWKGEKDPYKIWLSEIILQQTRVEQGTAYFNRFVARYPEISMLAAAKDDDVFKLWEGLGYYSRCRNLLATARFVQAELNGIFPSAYAELLALKGVGPYTAAAIASFAFNLPNAVVDGNVYRVLSRYFGIATAVDSAAGKAQFSELALQVLDRQNSALYNQAIMDFGATVCKPQIPLCSICMLKENCFAFKKNLVAELPIKEKKIIKKKRWFYYVILEQGKKLLVKKRVGKDVWQNLHEFMLVETQVPQKIEDILLGDEIMMLKLKDYKILNVSGIISQQLTHQTIHGTFVHIQCNSLTIPPGMEMVGRQDLEKLAFPKLINNYMETMAPAVSII